jgi:hypothetical protein
MRALGATITVATGAGAAIAMVRVTADGELDQLSENWTPCGCFA